MKPTDASVTVLPQGGEYPGNHWVLHPNWCMGFAREAIKNGVGRNRLREQPYS
jgi:hypothetical protein